MTVNPQTAPVVLLGGSLNALSVARSMGPRGRDVYFLSDQETSRFARSRFVAGCLPYPGSPDKAKARWLDWLKNESSLGAVLLPGGDTGLEFLAHHRDDVLTMGHYPTELNADMILAMLDKRKTFELATAAGIEAPRIVELEAVDQVSQVAETFDFPCALKPVHSHHFRDREGRGKAIRVDSAEELEFELRPLLEDGIRMLVTEIVPGPDDAFCSYYTYFDPDGTPVVHYTKRKLRQFPIRFGTGTYHLTEWVPDAQSIGLRFFEAVGLRGLGNVEFKRDPRDGRLKLIECNPRLTHANDLVRRSGVDFAEIAYQRALGRREPVHVSIKNGTSQLQPVKDARSFWRYRKEGELTFGGWAKTVARRHQLTVFSLRDPVPVMQESSKTFGRAIQKGVARLRG